MGNMALSLFQEVPGEKLPFVVNLDGNVNGEVFKVEGSGFGNASTGELEGKYVCTTGEMPISWLSMVCQMNYGMLCFARYPNTIKDFFKSAMPDGYTQDRTIVYENDGTFETRAKVFYKDGVIYNNLTVEGKGFKKDGHVRAKRLHSLPPQLSYIVPYGDGIRLVFKNVLPTKDGGYQVVDYNQTSEPLKITDDLVRPVYHFMRAKFQLSEDPNEKKDHIVIKETVAACSPDFS